MRSRKTKEKQTAQAVQVAQKQTLHTRMDAIESGFEKTVESINEAFMTFGERLLILEETLNALISLIPEQDGKTGPQRLMELMHEKAKQHSKAKALELFTLGIESGAMTPCEVVHGESPCMFVGKELDLEGNVTKDFVMMRFDELHEDLRGSVLGLKVGDKFSSLKAPDGRQYQIEITGVYNLDVNRMAALLQERNMVANGR